MVAWLGPRVHGGSWLNLGSRVSLGKDSACDRRSRRAYSLDLYGTTSPVALMRRVVSYLVRVRLRIHVYV